ncbi:MAG: T9SS type A sorting domain-containing protein [bacterium]|nr:T9SS type A sorting domain-containing protein [bacterium]
MRRDMFSLGYILMFICLLASPPTVMAQDEVMALYGEGSLSFDYAQWPFGSYGGTFAAEGAVLDTLLWGGEQVESCGGSMQSVSDTTIVWAYGAKYNSDTTVDVAAIFVRGDGEIAPGSYDVDPTDFMAGFIFFDGVSELAIPEEAGDIIEWLGAVQADYKFFSSSGTITLAAVGEMEFSGAFSGSAIDPESFMMISVSGGQFDMTGVQTGIEEPPAASLRAAVYPNPFNPQTHIVCSLDVAQQVRVTIHDARGRLVATLADGQFAAGDHGFDWHAVDAQGVPLPGGLYLYRVSGESLQVSGKMVLLP